jgi:hypothetical protein
MTSSLIVADEDAWVESMVWKHSASRVKELRQL